MSSERLKIYISAPYTKGDVALNVRRAIKAADELLEKGHYPYIPHLTHFWHLVSPHDWDVWLEIDLAYLPSCDAVLRLDGESKGADIEVGAAEQSGIPIYYSLEEISNAL